MCCRHATLSWQQAVNESHESWPSKDAHMLLSASAETGLAAETGDKSTRSLIVERLNKPRHANPCIRTMTDLPEVNSAQYLPVHLLLSEVLNSQNYKKKVYG